MDLEKRYEEGYNLVVVDRKRQGIYLCSKDKEVEDSGTIRDYDSFEFDEGFEWPYTFNVIYNIEDLIDLI